jgi:hypothetical protein
LDASLLIRVLLKAKKESIPIWTIHDAFYVEPRYQERVQQFYKASLIELDSENIFLSNLDPKLIKNVANVPFEPNPSLFEEGGAYILKEKND